MQTILKTLLAAVAALSLAACGSFGDSKDDVFPAGTPTVAEKPVVVTPAPVLETVTVTPTAAAFLSTAHIDAEAFLEALVESGCKIDKAEYREVKRGGAIKVTCTKSADLLNSQIEDF